MCSLPLCSVCAFDTVCVCVHVYMRAVMSCLVLQCACMVYSVGLCVRPGPARTKTCSSESQKLTHRYVSNYARKHNFSTITVQIVLNGVKLKVMK